MLKMKLNGKTITSSRQLEREFQKSFDKQLEKGLKKAAGPGVKLRKTAQGYVAEGSPEKIDQMRRRLR